MKNILTEILDIISYDDKDKDEKLESIRQKITPTEIEKINDLELLKEYLKMDIEANNFDIELHEVAGDEYKRILKLKQ